MDRPVYILCDETQYCVGDRHRSGRRDFFNTGELRSDPTAADETLAHGVSISPLSYSVLEPGQY